MIQKQLEKDRIEIKYSPSNYIGKKKKKPLPFGFIGVLILLFIYFLLLIRILRVARNSRNNFGKYVALGTCLLLFLHIFINIGMNMGLLPVTGIPLPLISYGGSATVMILICLGLVQSVQSSQRSVDIADNLMVTSRSLLMN